LPSDSKENKVQKTLEIEKSNKYAAEVPLETARLCLEVMTLSKKLIELGNPNSVTDAGVAVEVAASGAIGACLNVIVNLNDIRDSAFKSEKSNEITEILKYVNKLKKETFDQTIKVIKNL
jgi:glutamate formiminotransferase/formiminotetrahydrofolate cyclodeaminase